MDFILFILVNAALFLRPSELVQGWESVQVYLPLILTCLAFSFFGLLSLLLGDRLRQQPLTLMVFALLPIIFLSNAANADLENAFEKGFEFFKVIIYYLLLITVIHSPQRLKRFLFWFTLFAAAITLLAVFQYHGLATLNLKPMEDVRSDGHLHQQVLVRLGGTGIFGDPNDFCALLVLAIPLCLYWIVDGQRNHLARALWVPLLLLFGYALVLTQSRGGFLAVLIAVLVLVRYRFSPRAALVLVMLIVPVGLVVFAARQTSFQTEDTAQSRFQLWQEGLTMMRENPVLGVGMDRFTEHSYLVAHNSYMHCYGELGLIGGTIFFSMFFFAIWALARLNGPRVVILNPTSRQLNPYLLTVVSGYAAMMMSLSLSYIVPTYMVLGLATVQLQQAATVPQLSLTRVNMRLVQRLALASACFLVVMYLTCRLLVRYS